MWTQDYSCSHGSFTHRPAPLGHLTCRLTPYYEYKLKLSYCIALPAHPEALAYHYPPAALPTQNLTDRTRIYTRIQACAHSFPPVLSLRCSSPFPSLSHPSSAARSRPFSLPSSAFLLLDCITSSRTLPRPLYLCTLPSPAPSPMAGNGSCSGAMPPPDSRRLRQQPALRAVVLLPSRH